MKPLVLPLLFAGLLGSTWLTPACSECTASATVYIDVVVTDRATRKGTDVAQVTIEGRPCASQGLARYTCPVTDAEGSFEIVATLDGRRSVGRAEAAANGCGGETRPASDVVRLLP